MADDAASLEQPDMNAAAASLPELTLIVAATAARSGGGGMGILLTGTAVLGSLEGVEHDGPLVSNNTRGSEESLGEGFARRGADQRLL